MITEELKFPNIEDLSVLSGLPESIMANDIIADLQKDMVRLGKPEREAVEIAERLSEAFNRERQRAVEACYLAGYLKGMADMGQRFKALLESRGEIEKPGSTQKK